MRIQKHIKVKLLLSVLFVLIVVNWQGSLAVYADSFFPIGNVEQSQLSYFVGIGITELGSEADSYDKNRVEGVLSDRLREYSFAAIQSNPLVESQLISGVAAPAGSKLSVFWFPWNVTGHDIYVHNAWLFAHDMRDLGFSPIVYRSLLYYSNGRSANQVGECLQLGALSTIPFNVEVRGRKIFDFVISQPIRIDQESVILSTDSNGRNYKYHITVTNESDYDEVVTVAGVERSIAPHMPISIEGAVDYYHELPRTLSLKGRKVGCLRDSVQSNLLAVSRNDIPANWFWGGIQFDKIGVSDVDNYCVARIDSDISVDWGGGVDLEGTVTVSAAPNYTVTPPETVRLELKVNRAGGIYSTSVVTEILVDPKILPYYKQLSGEYKKDGSKIVFVSDMSPNSSKIIALEFDFPDQLLVDYYHQPSTLRYSVNGDSIKEILFDFKLINKESIVVTPIDGWCTHRKYHVNIENEGNAVVVENMVPIYTADYMTVDVFDSSSSSLISRYEFTKGEYIIKLPSNSIVMFNTANLRNIRLSTKQLSIPNCQIAVSSKNEKVPVQNNNHLPTPTKQKVIEDAEFVEKQEVNGIKSDGVASIREVKVGSYSILLVSLLFIAIIIVIGAIKYAQSYSGDVPKKR